VLFASVKCLLGIASLARLVLLAATWHSPDERRKITVQGDAAVCGGAFGGRQSKGRAGRNSIQQADHMLPLRAQLPRADPVLACHIRRCQIQP